MSHVTAHAVVFSQQQMSQNHHQHQQQRQITTGFFLHKNDKRHNVTMFGVMMLYFCFVLVHINYGATFHYNITF